MSAWSIAVLIVAGGLGAGARFVVDGVVMRGRTDAFPLGILLVNVSGSFVLGVVTGLASVLGAEWTAILGIGLLGGYTTFSTVSLETVLLARSGRRTWAWANVLVTLVASVVAAGIGVALGALFAP